MAQQTSGGWEIHTFNNGTIGRAQFSADRDRRYCLIRRWRRNEPDRAPVGRQPITWVMLNPSTAGADVDDATIRKVHGYSERWGFPGFRVLNLFSLIATDPAALWAHGYDSLNDPPNRSVWRALVAPLGSGPAEQPPPVMVAWGNDGNRYGAGELAYGQLSAWGIKPRCIGVTASGQPLHPGRTAYDLKPYDWTP